MRLGVARALVDGEWVAGDVDLDAEEGRVAGVGRSPAGRGLAVPGLVDLQVNGFGGVDFLATDIDGYRRAGEALAAHGVTAYQPTLITAPPDDTVAALDVLSAAAGDAGPGSPRILGAHLEGPFLARERAGAHPVEHLRPPDAAVLERFLGAGPVTQVTLAPELDGAAALVRRLAGAGVLVSCGHSGADAAQAHATFDAGARTVTHLFNAMGGLTARRPGLAGVALGRRDVTIQLIADRVHLADDTVRLAWAAAADRTVVVSDAIAAAGLGDGTYRLGSAEVTVRGAEARRADGVLAGSVTGLDAAVRNLVELGVPLVDALAAATARPARLIGRPDLGTLAPAATADVAVLDDDLTVRAALVGGRPVGG